ncbi:SatD family protein [Pareuzebyella sediminis]|uniref:SatD family protein n=1 Tax=Pareuzebyella sediminis TaxID=2607998 RepID=UPI0011EF1C6F|nr:SatD family protein [Pareuzebyella sediminis]
MIAIITGDIIDSENHKSSVWLGILKEYLSKIGQSPLDWEIYRGDEFQLKIQKDKALETAIHLKAILKTIKGLDVRMGIGIGTETYKGSSISESNGPAYHRSGRTLESLKEEKITLKITTGHDFIDQTLNLMLKLALNFMDDWSQVSAEIVSMTLENRDASQTDIAQILDIQQSAVSQRQKRARLDLVFDLLDYYSHTLKEIR